MKCRFCSKDVKDLFVSLGASPLSNAFLQADRLQKMEAYYPLDVYVCRHCFLVQLDEFELAQNIFTDNYAYYSSFSNSWLDHCRRYVEKMIPQFNLDSSSQVVEVASNDGYLLQYFVEKGIPVLGIEPSANTAEVARQKGVATEVCFFNTATAKSLSQQGKSADLMLGNNVLAHVPNLNDFISALKILLKPHGVITMEFPHLEKLIEEVQFDTIYHEHFSYFSLSFVQMAFLKHGLRVFDVEELPTHGGSLRIYAAHAERDILVRPAVTEIVSRELQKGFSNSEFYQQFGKRVARVRNDLLKFLITCQEQGKSVVAYGAAAKGNTLLNYCGVKNDLISYVVDLNPYKQNRFLPGSRLPIFSPKKIFTTKPDYVLILPWNIKDEVIEQMQAIREWGGQFVLPLPKLQVI